MNYGVIGTGWITDSFIDATKKHAGGMELSAVYSREQAKGQAFAEKYGRISIYTNPEEMAESDEIDAVYIASPNLLHYEQSKLFLSHGKHVLCEKPLCVTPDQIIELMEMAKQNNRIYMEAIIMLHQPQRKLLHDAVKKIGNITSARLDLSQLSSKYQSFLDGKLPNIFNPTLATGSLMDLGIYCVYPLIDLFGMPDEIISTAGFLSSGADGFGNSIFVYPDKQALLTYSKTGQSRIGSEIIGDKGSIVIGSISELTDIKIVWNDGSEEKVFGGETRAVLMGNEAKSFLNYILDPTIYKKEYEYGSELALLVSKAMEIIRAKANIKF